MLSIIWPVILVSGVKAYSLVISIFFLIAFFELQYSFIAISIGSYATAGHDKYDVSMNVSLYSYISWISILFSVNVPVLSVHKTFTAPNVSIVFIFLVKVFFFVKSHAPIARKTVNTTGISSGIVAIAIVTPAKMDSTILSEKINSGWFI